MSEAKHPGGPGARRELPALSPRVITIFGIALAATVIVCLILGVWIFNFLADRAAKRDAPPSPLAKREAPSEPLLQVAAPKDLAEMRAAEEKTLTTYDWVNKQAGTVRIPIERAMQLLAERGLPAASGEQSPPAKAKRK
ncbi:MAG TPA: hypothetical protein VEU07_03470 [Candidatus Acidoferrum sp.]|nr:hypothetical protein [Candidatus Acidoferrum sp.]